MKAFTDLYLAIDQSNRTGDKVAAMANYFRAAQPADAVWVVHLLSGRKLGRTISSRQMRQWAAEVSGYPAWLVDESYRVVGDLSETLSLLVPFEDPVEGTEPSLNHLITQVLKVVGRLAGDDQRQLIISTWRGLTARQRFVFHKLISGNFRFGVSQRLMMQALSAAAGVEPALMAQRLAGRWEPTAEFYRNLIAPSSAGQVGNASALPFPFMLANPLNQEAAALGAVTDWLVEQKWDGIRCQMIRPRGDGDRCLLWSRGEEPVTAAFPELEAAAHTLPPGTTLDGEIVAWDDAAQRPMPFASLQQRLNRKTVEAVFWQEVPVRFMAFDVLRQAGVDIRDLPLRQRRELLKGMIHVAHDPCLLASPTLMPTCWADVAATVASSRERCVEGVILKRIESVYAAGGGRPAGVWWKWKIEPYTVDVVLTAAQPGTGRRAGLLTDYTFAIWNDNRTELVTIAKAYSGLTDAEIAELDQYIRRVSTGRYGQAHTVPPKRVFELGFEAIQPSGRHKAGLALRFPRILRARPDKSPEQADSIASLRQLLGPPATNA